MDPPLVPIVATTAGTAVLLVALAWYLRDARRALRIRRTPWKTRDAVVDPMNSFWTELDWLVAEDTPLDYALTDLDRVVALAYGREIADASSVLDAVDIDTVLNELKARAIEPGVATWRAGDGADPLRAYLETLGDRQNPVKPLLTIR